MKLWICLAVIIIILTSCGNTYQCPKQSLITAYVSYTDMEIDTIILRRFTLRSNFTQKVDSTILTTNNCQVIRRSDTVELFLPDIKNRFTDEYDWQIVNPFDQKTVSISDMVFQIEEKKSGGLFSMDPAACFSPILSYKRDNTIVTPAPNSGNSYLYIHK
ncbi:MAG: hypothetical protein ACHQFX_06120 [Chitinophagales bacterium]